MDGKTDSAAFLELYEHTVGQGGGNNAEEEEFFYGGVRNKVETHLSCPLV